MNHSIFNCIAIALLSACLTGCIARNDNEVVVYCALDKEFSGPVLDQFESESGITVLAKFDQESNKTVGLANEIIQLGGSQRCDLFWNNEILHTLRFETGRAAGRLLQPNGQVLSAVICFS